MDDATREARERSGLEVVGCYAFGTSPAQADALLAVVTRGRKRATAGALVELDGLDDPTPEAGQLWGLLDGAGALRHVAETIEVAAGRLHEVTPAFAWDEGEDDRTRESWLRDHRDYVRDVGVVGDPDEAEVLFERFTVVWPVRDETVWWADGVRTARHDEHAVVRDLHRHRHGEPDVHAHGERWDGADLPALVAERRGRIVGAATFRPRPGGEAVVFSLDLAPGAGDEVEVALRQALDRLAADHGWRRVAFPPANVPPSAGST